MYIALLEDDPDQGVLLRDWLRDAGHECRLFDSAHDFTGSVSAEAYDLLVVDWLLPDSSGIEVLEWVRRELGWGIPVLFVTRRDAEEDIVMALERGADDYMPKPVRRAEMLARVKALGRRGHGEKTADQIQRIGAYTIDIAGRTIKHGEKAVDLTQKEFDLAVFLFNNPDRVFSRGKLLERVWGRSPNINTRTVDTHVSRIRKKLELNPENGWRLSAVYQYGYRLERLPETADNSRE